MHSVRIILPRIIPTHVNVHWLLAGQAFTISGGSHRPESMLISWNHLTGQRTLDAPVTWESTGDSWQLTLAPWQRLYWVMLMPTE